MIIKQSLIVSELCLYLGCRWYFSLLSIGMSLAYWCRFRAGKHLAVGTRRYLKRGRKNTVRRQSMCKVRLKPQNIEHINQNSWYMRKPKTQERNNTIENNIDPYGLAGPFSPVHFHSKIQLVSNFITTSKVKTELTKAGRINWRIKEILEQNGKVKNQRQVLALLWP